MGGHVRGRDMLTEGEFNALRATKDPNFWNDIREVLGLSEEYKKKYGGHWSDDAREDWF